MLLTNNCSVDLLIKYINLRSVSKTPFKSQTFEKEKDSNSLRSCRIFFKGKNIKLSDKGRTRG